MGTAIPFKHGLWWSLVHKTAHGSETKMGSVSTIPVTW